MRILDMRKLNPLAAALFVAAIPVFLIATNVRLVINAPPLYSYGFDRYDIEQRTGIERDELLSAGRQIRNYFNSGEEYLAIGVVRRGVVYGNLYNPPSYSADESAGYSRELLHMKDVKSLVRGVYRIQEISGIFLAAFVLVGLVALRRRFLASLAHYVGLGGILTVGLVVLVGLASVAGFDRLFRAFHLLSFSNDFWQLDPRHHYLIAMFPQGFFLDATLLIVGLTVLEALLLTMVPVVLLSRWRPDWARRIARRLAMGAEG